MNDTEGENSLNMSDPIADAMQSTGLWKNALKRTDVSGGILNKAAVYDTEKGAVFVKYSKRDNAFGMFTSERESLRLLKAMDVIRVPTPGTPVPLPTGGALLTMEHIPELAPVSDRWDELGTRMARLHLYNAEQLTKAAKNEGRVHKSGSNNDTAYTPTAQFGFHVPQYVGADFMVPAGWSPDWVERFARVYLAPCVETLVASTASRTLAEMWSRLQPCIHRGFLGDSFTPALTHGDFCTINVGQTSREAVLFDPGCSYSHHETDLIIPHMDGDFPREFFTAYHTLVPASAGWEARMKLYHCYAYALVSNMHVAEQDNAERALQCGLQYIEMVSKTH